jgi:hypothetical protein
LAQSCYPEAEAQMDRFGELLYFANVLGALPAFIVLETIALLVFKGWSKLAPLAPGVYISWLVFDEFASGIRLFLEGAIEQSDFRRFLYEQWSMTSRPSLGASGILVFLFVVRALFRRFNRSGTR